MKKFLFSVFAFLFTSMSANATPITYTGAKLLQLSAVRVISGLQQVNPNGSLTFAIGDISDAQAAVENLLAFDLSRLVQDQTNFSIIARITPRTSDFDPGFAVSDGNNAAVGNYGDNLNGALAGYTNVTLSADERLLVVEAGQFLVTNIGTIAIGATLEIRHDFEIYNEFVRHTLSAQGFSGSYVDNRPYNSTSPLTLYFTGDSNGEIYELNSITFLNAIDPNSIPADVPEPSTLPMTLLPLAGLIVWRRRRRT